MFWSAGTESPCYKEDNRVGVACNSPEVPSKPANSGSGIKSAAKPYYPPITGQQLGGPHADQGAASGTTYPHQDHLQKQQHLQDALSSVGGKPGSFSAKLKVYGEKAKAAKESAKEYVGNGAKLVLCRGAQGPCGNHAYMSCRR